MGFTRNSLGVIAMAALLSGCGAVYFSPRVPTDDPNIDVVPVTANAVLQANAQPYAPKSLPSVFFRAAGGSGAGRGAGALPEPVLEKPQRPRALPLRVPPEVTPGPYRIGVGDQLLLSNTQAVPEGFGESGLMINRQSYTVLDDGAIAVPNIGRIDVAGMTLEEAEAELFERLVANRIDPAFGLEISGFNARRVSVGGAVREPGVVPIALTPLTLSEALTGAGGVSARSLEYASIRVYRDGELYQIPMKDYLRQARLQKIRLTDGDSVFVDSNYDLDAAQAYFREQITLIDLRQSARRQALSELDAEIARNRAALNEQRENYLSRAELDAVDRDYVYLTGEVENPSRFALPFGRQASVADALLGQGGLDNTTGDPGQIYVLRSASPDADKVTALHLDARNARTLVLATRLQLRPNDVIFVAEQPITRWGRVVQQIAPSLITTTVTESNK